MTEMVLLGFEVGSGQPVYMPLHHLAVFGMTQKSGKTKTIESLISRADLKAIAFITKRGEGGFSNSHLVPPYYKPRADWQFVEGLVNVALGEKVKYEPGMRYAIMKVCRGQKDLKEIRKAAQDMAQASKREFMRSVYEKLVAYLDIVVPELEKWVFSDALKLSEGINVMDLSGMRLETQHIVIASTIEYAFANLDHVVVIIPEAWETIPQGRMTPVKWVAQQFIRKGAVLGNYLWLDSQDIGGIDKTPLRQCDNWLMGRMKEAHEVERILKQLLGAKVPAAEIQTLPLGHFYAAIGNQVAKVYVLPVGVPEDVGVQVAQGKRSPESVRDEFLKVKVTEDDSMYKEKFEALQKQFEDFKAESKKQIEQLHSLNKSSLSNEIELKRLQLIIENKDKEIQTLQHDAGAGRKLRELLEDFTAVKIGKIGEVSDVSVQEELPNMMVKVVRPVLESSEANWRGRLLLFVAKGYFEEPRKLTPIRERLQQDYGSLPNSALISNELVELLKMHFLERKQENGQWVYFAYPGGKDRIKEAES